jgi:hypothetical protein
LSAWTAVGAPATANNNQQWQQQPLQQAIEAQIDKF